MKPIWILFLAAFLTARASESPVSGDGSGAYSTGKYRNLFAEAGHPQENIRRKIDSAFYMMSLLHCGGEFKVW
jgi:oligosaccharide reducing-end xylanase